MVAADDDGQEAGPSGIGRPQSTLSGASVIAAASDEEDEGVVSIAVQFRAVVPVSFPHIYTSIGVYACILKQYSEIPPCRQDNNKL